MLKVCKVCGEYKEESEFPVHSHGKLRSTCKVCWNQRNRTKRAENADKYRERFRLYYQANRAKVLERTSQWGKTHRAERRKVVAEFRERRYKEFMEYKKTLSCVICGENDPICIDFHHLNESEKEYQISDLVMSREKMEEELKKCVPVCANCHRKIHYYGSDKYPQLNKFEEQ